MIKSFTWQIKGMNRDTSVSRISPEFAYENRNIRITPNKDNTLLSMINERGNRELSIDGIDRIDGIPIGSAIINNQLVLFTTNNEGQDCIYKLWFEEDILKGQKLFGSNIDDSEIVKESKDLKFNTANPIETLCYFENEDIQKIYWTDGKNPLRVINIAGSNTNNWNNKSFNFVSEANLKEIISVERDSTSSGLFSSGVIQYAFTYFNKYGKETNIIYVTPLNYITYDNRGADTESKVNCCFYITINNIDHSYDYLRIYSIHRSSINSTPEVKKVTDLAIEKESNSLQYIDNGIGGESIDPTELLYIGGEDIVAQTLEQKDGTLFLGDITLHQKAIDKNIKQECRNLDVKFTIGKSSLNDYIKLVPYPKSAGYYSYENQLYMNSQQIKTFKYLEYYRLGIQAQHKTGKWSEPIFIKDLQNNVPIGEVEKNGNSIEEYWTCPELHPFVQREYLAYPYATTTINSSSEILQYLKDNDYVKIRPVVVYPTINDRECICQGILCPTVYNLGSRQTNSPFAQSSWFIRPNAPYTDTQEYIQEGKFYKEKHTVYRFYLTKEEGLKYKERPKGTLFFGDYTVGMQYLGAYGSILGESFRVDGSCEIVYANTSGAITDTGYIFSTIVTDGIAPGRPIVAYEKFDTFEDGDITSEEQFIMTVGGTSENVTGLGGIGTPKVGDRCWVTSHSFENLKHTLLICREVYYNKERTQIRALLMGTGTDIPLSEEEIPRKFDHINKEYYLSADTLTINYISKVNIRDWNKFNTSEILDPSLYSPAGIMTNDPYEITYGGDKKVEVRPNFKGAWAEFRHNEPLPECTKVNCEIQSSYNTLKNPFTSFVKSEVEKYEGQDSFVMGIQNADRADLYSNNFFVDQSIVTLHSPDIEFDDEIKDLENANLKLRIVGCVPLTASSSDIDIQVITPPNEFKGSSVQAPGFKKFFIGTEGTFDTDSGFPFFNALPGDSYFGFRGLISAAVWLDEIAKIKKDGNTNHLSTGFVIYPWHRETSLSNDRPDNDNERTPTGKLKNKKMANLKFSYKPFFYKEDEIWNAYKEEDSTFTGISGVSIFDSNEISLLKINPPKDSNLSQIHYYGNVDKVVTYSNDKRKKDEGEVKDAGYPIIIGGTQNAESAEDKILIYSSKYRALTNSDTDYSRTEDPIRIKYKSSPHMVIALNYAKDGGNIRQRILPIGKGMQSVGGELVYYDLNPPKNNFGYPLWGSKSDYLALPSYEALRLPTYERYHYGIGHGWLWLGEIYNDKVTNRFGGDSEEAIEANQWLPCGNSVNILDAEGNTKDTTLIWEEGDTYFQRYDNLKTYPFTKEDHQSIIDVVSFMCETRVNIDGRYDKNRGDVSNLSITPENYNKINKAYSQPNNFFNYRTINSNLNIIDDFHNTITWTKTKLAGDLIDKWTNITMANTLDLDGDKGYIRKLKRFNNQLFAFQDSGISHILYNENVQISSTEGVPIEIANSGKVQGKRYITNTVGCTNKWSIVESPKGLYFIDDNINSLMFFNGQLTNLSDNRGFHSWLANVSTNKVWSPSTFDNVFGYYDKINNEVLFITKHEALAFSEIIEQFTSFYSYGNIFAIGALGNKSICVNTDKSSDDSTFKVWLQNDGEYNYFFNKYEPFSTTVIANPDMPRDKIFNTLEFRADCWSNEDKLLDTTFDTLQVWNEYQQGKSKLKSIKDNPSNLKRKFRIWRAIIPRDSSSKYNRDRIRNPWAYIKLSMDDANTNSTILHDMILNYSV